MYYEEVSQVSKSRVHGDRFDGVDGPTAARDDSDLARAIGARIRELRVAQGMSMRTLAPLADLKQPFLSQLERGVSSPSMLSLYKLAKALGVAPGDLLPDEPVTPGAVVFRSGEGHPIHSVDGAVSSAGRLLFTDADHELEISEFDILPEQNNSEWFDHIAEAATYVMTGELRVEVENGGEWVLGRRDVIFCRAGSRSRWTALDPAGTSLLHVIARRRER
ncbi:helix-turn-helix domain-containing protein [Gordonia desulfuricans]|nr:helix-turn-helix domain-containing protein [Gordonia desulfuricans]